ncbi:MAG: carbohydrate ABC transporter permease [Candidatus Limnocylindria bacterium]|nr:sugar ABC transporter permease [Chloroflexota bacterium]MBA3584937.1 sugar ABC transporter permease [Gemmatimonadota bacterium]MDQ3399530.1 sugar ABC transporter permease [Chloroflexota bacterium]
MPAALRRHGWSYLFVLPTFSLFVVFTLLPVAQAFALSLQSASVVGGEWIGFENFATLAEDPVFRQALGNTVLFTVVVVAAQIVLALVVASLIQPLGRKNQTFYRALFYLPLVNSAILVAMVWRWIFNPNPFGLANTALGAVGLGPFLWIGSSDEALLAVILSAVLTIPGGGVVLYSAAINSLPRELYEAADVEGAGWFTKWWRITVPLLKPTTLYLLVIYTILAFQIFERVYVMTNGGGPNNATITIVQLIYSTAFQFGRYGLASAMAVVLFVMAVAVAVLQFRSLRSDVEY